MIERLTQLEKNLVELKKIRSEISLEEIKTDALKQWALRYGLLETIQIAIDISCHITNKFNLGNPKTYAECVELLHANNYLHDEIAKKIKGMIGLRNLLVHEYSEIDVDKLYLTLDSLDDFVSYAEAIKNFV